MSKIKFSVGRFRPEDKKAWIKLWKGYVPDCASPFVLKSNWQAMMANDGRLDAFRLHVSGQTVGFALYTFHHYTKSMYPDCYLADVYVDPPYRGKGGGKQLIERVIKESRRQKSHRVWWITAEVNTKAQMLYNKISKGTDWKRYIVRLMKT